MKLPVKDLYKVYLEAKIIKERTDTQQLQLQIKTTQLEIQFLESQFRWVMCPPLSSFNANKCLAEHSSLEERKNTKKENGVHIQWVAGCLPFPQGHWSKVLSCNVGPDHCPILCIIIGEELSISRGGQWGALFPSDSDYVVQDHTCHYNVAGSLQTDLEPAEALEPGLQHSDDHLHPG